MRLYQRNGYKGNASDAVAQLYAHHGLERPSSTEKPLRNRGVKGQKGLQQQQQQRAFEQARFAQHMGSFPMQGMVPMPQVSEAPRAMPPGCWNRAPPSSLLNGLGAAVGVQMPGSAPQPPRDLAQSLAHFGGAPAVYAPQMGTMPQRRGLHGCGHDAGANARARAMGARATARHDASTGCMQLQCGRTVSVPSLATTAPGGFLQRRFRLGAAQAHVRRILRSVIWNPGAAAFVVVFGPIDVLREQGFASQASCLFNGGARCGYFVETLLASGCLG